MDPQDGAREQKKGTESKRSHCQQLSFVSAQDKLLGPVAVPRRTEEAPRDPPSGKLGQQHTSKEELSLPLGIMGKLGSREVIGASTKQQPDFFL